MKKFLLACLLATTIAGCSKKSSSNPTPNNISTQIVGTWLQVKNVTTYTDLSGVSHISNNNVTDGTVNGHTNYVINADGTARKTYTDNYSGQTFQTYITAVPYSIFSKNGKSFIDFAVSPGDISDTYQIVTLTDHSLILNINYGNEPSNIIPGTNLTGTNAVLDEEYSR